MSLFVSSFAAPLCACLDVDTAAHDCCAGMKDHCPMKGPGGDSLDKTRPAGCSCFAEKRQTAPTKLSENSKSQPLVPALLPDIRTFKFTVHTESMGFPFAGPSYTEQLFPKQHPARAPPRL